MNGTAFSWLLFTIRSNHLLEPEEKPSDRTLQLVCKNCRFVKPASDYRVFVHEIKMQEEYV